ncbi:cobalamin ABC transporter ATP-binding protein [Tersicoccus solisilvae]|uniref:Mycobactin import ATP-binding/permease protein IrtA n=1 Tax=Tersicoccus solisilvae TaxID=1882339 RepID=A0ABQ1NLN0_9MICC|nr:SIP domain-containing protein [Tersicoccus solisilvae]GGC80252.1 cobalamin ABC transporter ATP-binding protein [Tersicoccus solisilvae]
MAAPSDPRAASAPGPAARSPERPSLRADAVTLGYDGRTVVDGLTVALPPGKITVIVGANACGKSTLLRGLSRLLTPRSGAVLLDGKDVHRYPAKELARRVGLLPQAPTAPEAVTAVDLVTRGRYPHQGFFQQTTQEDRDAVAEAMVATGTLDLAARPVDELSGGQRQRVWIAMALAQQTGVLLLDEPTTYLDVTHQIEVLDLITDLNRTRGTTIALVLHDVNLASRYADHLIAMKGGAVVAEGAPGAILTADRVREVFGLDARVLTDPVSGTPMIVPIGRHHRATTTPGDPPRPDAPRTDAPWAMRRLTDTGPTDTDPTDTPADHAGPVRPPRGGAPMTTATTSIAPIVAIDAEVIAVHRLSPHYRRIVFGGPGLEQFGPDRDPLDLRIKLLIPTPGRPAPMLEVTDDGWYQRWLAADPDARGQMRTYTVRSVDDETDAVGDVRRTVTVDFVLHGVPREDGHPGDAAGPAAQWAAAARPGDHLCLLGPNRAIGGRSGIEFDPGPARRLLLVADETAVPAVASILASGPAQTGDVYLEVPTADDILDLPPVPGISVTWLARDGAAHGDLLIGAVRSALGLTCAHRDCGADCVLLGYAAERMTVLPAPVLAETGLDAPETLLWETPQYSSGGELLDEARPAEPGMPDDQLYAWIAGESGMVKHLRRCLVSERGMSRHRVAFMGYWRQGAAQV